jgi:hypothetical protein
VHEDSVLVIEPGCKIIFSNHYELKVEGKLYAVGKVNDSIVFTVTDTLGFSDTTIRKGGWRGIRFYQNQIEGSKLRFCDLSYGKALGSSDSVIGGAIYAYYYKNIHISRSTIHHNLAADKGGGIGFEQYSHITIDSCLIHHNRSYNWGGGISNGENSRGYISNCRIEFNKSLRQSYGGYTGMGGGIATFGFANGPIILNNYIVNNYSIGAGGIADNSEASVIVGNVICNNHGGGIVNGHSNATTRISNNTICNNSDGHGIDAMSSTLSIFNNILWGNRFNMQTDQMSFYFPYHPNFTPHHNTIEAGSYGPDNISNDPRFILPTTVLGVDSSNNAFNWDLLDSSACINAGFTDTINFTFYPTDIIGQNRFFGNTMDIGAYENQTIIDDINTSKAPSIQVFPNPTSGLITIDIMQVQKVELVDITGKTVLQTTERQLDLSDLENGVYLLRIWDHSRIYSKKIILHRP